MKGSGFFEKDEVQYSDKISEVWNEPIQISIDIIRQLIKKQLVSVYLRGSVENNTQISHISDIDLVIIFSKSISLVVRNKLQRRLDVVRKDYPFVSKVDLMYINILDIKSTSKRVLVKLTSRCVFGSSVERLIPNLQAGNDIAVTLNTLKADLHSFLGSNKYSSKEKCTWMMKKILRSGAELVSERSGLYIRDLYCCYKVFIKFYPKYRKEMYECLKLAIAPCGKTKKVRELVVHTTSFLMNESVRLNIINNNPRAGLSRVTGHKVASASNRSVVTRGVL